eukprot:274496-Hanusia_phi.AAC.1
MPRKRKEPTNAGFYIRTETLARKCALKKHLTWDSLLLAENDDANADFDDDMSERTSEMNFSCEEEPPPPTTTNFTLQCNSENMWCNGTFVQMASMLISVDRWVWIYENYYELARRYST